jgi:uncharacterized repeat protein (TIGR01451 family)
VTTDGTGTGTFAFTHGAALVPGSFVTATATDFAYNTSEFSACIAVSAAVLPDLTVAKTHSGPFFQGQAGATYSITVTNSGPGATGGTTTVVDTLPAGLTATAMAGAAGPDWACTLATLTCTSTAVVAPGASFPAITLTVDVAPNAPASVTNAVAVSGGGQVVTTNDTAQAVTAVAAGPDLTVTKTHAGSFHPGQLGATYTITVTNSGGTPTYGTTTVTDTLPAGLTATAITGPGWSCSLSTLSCTSTATVTPEASFPPITLTVSVAADATGSLVNSVSASGGGEVNGTNSAASDPTTIGAAPAAIPVTGWSGLALLAAAILGAGVLALRR